MKKRIRLLALICVALGLSSQLFAQIDGARAYWPEAKGTDIITPMYTYINSNRVANNNLFYKGGDFTTNITGLQYTKVFNVKGRTTSFSCFWGYGATEGDATGENQFKAGMTSGISDISGMLTFNLFGAPSITPEEYLKSEYDWIVDMQLEFTVPIGEYDYDKYLNLGANRWKLKAGFPIVKFYDWGTTKVSSIELLPSVSFYTNNDDPVRNSDALLKQDPTFSLEAHYTRNFNKILWASADAYYIFGGETSIHTDPSNDDDENDDYSIDEIIYNDDQINSLYLGLSVGVDLTKRISAKVSGGGVVYNGDDTIDGMSFRVSASYKF